MAVVGIGAAARCAGSKGAGAQCAYTSLDGGSANMSISKSVRQDQRCLRGSNLKVFVQLWRNGVATRQVRSAGLSPTLLCGARVRDALQLSMRATSEQRKTPSARLLFTPQGGALLTYRRFKLVAGSIGPELMSVWSNAVVYPRAAVCVVRTAQDDGAMVRWYRWFRKLQSSDY